MTCKESAFINVLFHIPTCSIAILFLMASEKTWCGIYLFASPEARKWKLAPCKGGSFLCLTLLEHRLFLRYFRLEEAARMHMSSRYLWIHYLCAQCHGTGGLRFGHKHVNISDIGSSGWLAKVACPVILFSSPSHSPSKCVLHTLISLLGPKQFSHRSGPVRSFQLGATIDDGLFHLQKKMSRILFACPQGVVSFRSPVLSAGIQAEKALPRFPVPCLQLVHTGWWLLTCISFLRRDTVFWHLALAPGLLVASEPSSSTPGSYLWHPPTWTKIWASSCASSFWL